MERPGTPQVTRATVLAKQDRSRNQYPHARPVQVLLRRVTDADYGPISGDGSVVPIIDRRLAWVVVVPDVRMCSPGRPIQAPRTPAPVPCGRGYDLTLVDARTGEILVGLEW